MLLLASVLWLIILPTASQSRDLRIMTFNTWRDGMYVKNGLQKIAKHIRLVNPDAVGLQEIQNPQNVADLIKMLGPDWTGLINQRKYPDTAILTRHKFQENSSIATSSCVAGKIIMNGSIKTIAMANCHLDYTSYGPYAAYNKLVTSIDQIMAGEQMGRGPGIIELLTNEKIKLWLSKTHVFPFIVTGDFNGPSHLDWGNETRDRHGGWAVEWPATKEMELAGFEDSYFETNKQAPLSDDYTWSTVNKFNPEWNYTIPEPMDRIDFIFSKGRIKPIASTRYSGTEPLKRIPYQKDNDYPSDHYAVISDFNFF